ncbi:OmpA/MotB family protein [Niveispirillum sp. KHB5.9]|uniref:OmpA/MotB family protein n=1 Tax=Niveispirillum sp. KHB5.9 TaxID=3400269 RepID=UPI003A85E31F
MAGETDRRSLSRGRRETDSLRLNYRLDQTHLARPVETTEESEEWVISYMDMVTVLMTVFLGMLAILGMDGRLAVKKEAGQAIADGVSVHAPDQVADAVVDATEPGRPSGPSLPGAASRPPPSAQTQAPPSPTANRLLQQLEGMGLPEDVDIHTAERKVTIVVRDRILFGSGSATLQPEAVELLRRLVPSLAGLRGSITVEGHSDDVAISTVRFPSNWELSAARAAAVVRELAAQGIAPARLGALGLADSRPITADPARRAENRRVEIVVDTDAKTAQAATR